MPDTDTIGLTDAEIEDAAERLAKKFTEAIRDQEREVGHHHGDVDAWNTAICRRIIVEGF